MSDPEVRTCDVYRTDENLPYRFNHPDCFHGYSQSSCHPLYQTSNQTYGSRRPSVHEMPTQFKVTRHKFSEDLLKTGMYRDHGFNTSVNKCRVTAAMATLNNKLNLHYRYYSGNQGSGNQQ